MTEPLLVQQLESPSGTGRVEPRSDRQPGSPRKPGTGYQPTDRILTGSSAWVPRGETERMPGVEDAVDEQVAASASRISADLLDAADLSIVGVYVHGSAVLGDFVEHASDLDILVVVEDDTDVGSIDDIARSLAASDPTPAVGVEASVVVRSAAASPRAPWPFLVHVTNQPTDRKTVYGLDRDGDPDLVLHYAVLRQHGWNLVGPPSAETFGAVDRDAIVDQLTAELRWAAETATESYAVLNACRALCFVTDGILCSKTQGGRWALAAGIEADLVERSLRARRGIGDAPPGSTASRAWVLSIARHLQQTKRNV